MSRRRRLAEPRTPRAALLRSTTGRHRLTRRIWTRDGPHWFSQSRLRRLLAIYRSQPRQACAGTRYTLTCSNPVAVDRINQVWAADITYLPMSRGSRGHYGLAQPVRAGLLSNTLEVGFCIAALKEAPKDSRSFNTDHRSPVKPSVACCWSGGSRSACGQYLCRAFVAERQVRGGISESLSRQELTLIWTCTIESGRTRLWAIGLRLRCLQKEGHQVFTRAGIGVIIS